MPNAFLGILYQAIIVALDHLCEQMTFFKQFHSLKLGPTCTRLDLITDLENPITRKKKFRQQKTKDHYFKKKKFQ